MAAVAWNCNGSQLAAAYGRTDHPGWCEHSAAVAVWSVFRRDFDPRRATATIEVGNCLTALAFHPSDPLLLAGGTLNGEIYLWNVDAPEDPPLAVSATDEHYHREAITKLVWVRTESLTSLAVKNFLLSTSTDGKILLWR